MLLTQTHVAKPFPIMEYFILDCSSLLEVLKVCFFLMRDLMYEKGNLRLTLASSNAVLC